MAGFLVGVSDVQLNAQNLSLSKAPEGLKIETEGDLARPVPTVFRALNSLNDAKGRRRHIRWRRRKVRMIEQICKCAFKAHPHALREMESLGQPSGDRRGAWPFQDSHTAISHRACRNRVEGSDVERAPVCGIRDVAVPDAIRALQAAAKRNVETARIEARTCGRRQIRSGLPKSDGADRPSAKRQI